MAFTDVEKKFDVTRIISIALAGLRDFGAITEGLVFTLQNSSDMCEFPKSELDRTDKISQGSFGVVETRYVNKTLVVSSAGSRGKYEKISCVFKINKQPTRADRDMQVKNVTTSLGSIYRVLFLPDPLMEVIMNSLATHLYDVGGCMSMSRLMGAFMCEVGDTVTTVMQKSDTTLFHAIDTNWNSVASDEHVLRGCVVQLLHAMYLLKVSYGFVHLDMHSANVLLEKVNGYGKSQYYNGVPIAGRKYVLYDTYNDSFDEYGVRVPRLLAVPIGNHGLVARIADFGAGVIVAGRGASAHSTSTDSVISTNMRVFNLLKGGPAAFRGCLESASYANTCDVKFILMDTYLMVRTLRNPKISAKLSEILQTYYKIIFDRQIQSEFTQDDVKATNSVMRRNVGMESGYDSPAYILNAIYALCQYGNDQSKIMPVSFPRSSTMSTTKRAAVYFVPPFYGGVVDETLNDENCILCSEDVRSSEDRNDRLLGMSVEHELGSTTGTQAERISHESTRLTPTPLYGKISYNSDVDIKVIVYANRFGRVKYQKGTVYSDGTPVPESLHGDLIPMVKVTEIRFPNRSRCTFSLSTLNKSISENTMVRVTVGNYTKSGSQVGQDIACVGDAITSLYEEDASVKRVKYPAWSYPFVGALIIPQINGHVLKFGELGAATISNSVKSAEVAFPCAPVLVSRQTRKKIISLKSDWNWAGVKANASDTLQPFATDAGIIPNNMLTSHAIITDDGINTSLVYIHGPSDGLPGVTRYNLIELINAKPDVKCAMCLSSGAYSTLQYRDNKSRISVTNTIDAHVPNLRTLNVSVL